MIPWKHLDTATVPDGGGELRLMQRGSDFSIRAGTKELMTSRLTGSEEALATITCLRLRGRTKPHILIGGLGMGFTLRAALASLGADAQVSVAELVPAVVAWARGPMAPIFGASLDDPRVIIHETDVSRLIRSARSVYDAILLDVDNGPEGLTRADNDRIYDTEGLGAARTALRPGGILAVWSSGPDSRFTKRLRSTGYEVNEVAVRANGKQGGSRHMIWIATN